MKPFSVHTSLMAAYEKLIGGGDVLGLATLTFTEAQGCPVVPVTHTEIVTDFVLMNGLSPKTFVERAEWRALLINFTPTKGLKVLLTVSQGGKVFPMRLWEGGLEAGG